MRPLLLKFGGTSVDDAAALQRLVQIVAERREHVPVVVVSAMRGATDALLQAVELARQGRLDEALERVQPQLRRSAEAARAVLAGEEAEQVRGAVDDALRQTGELLRVVAAHPGTRLPLQDEIVSFGERLSATLVAAVLRAGGLPGRYVDARRCVVTTEEHTRADPLPDHTREHSRAELLPLLEDGQVPVLGGFIGSARSGATTTLGRGGSDFSAALLGAALDAAEVQIWTDVTGFLTADPRVVPGARSIAHLSYTEAAELAYFGAKVLHPRTIQPAVERGIPVRICNSRRPEEPGTRIDAAAEPAPHGIKAIAHKPGITLVRVASARMLGAYGFLRALFEVFDRHRTAVDVVATSEVSVSLSLEDVEALPAVLDELRTLGSVHVEEGQAIICVVGQGLADTPGIAARVFGTLADINVALISQGASSLNLTCVVREADAAEAVARLHAAFFE